MLEVRKRVRGEVDHSELSEWLCLQLRFGGTQTNKDSRASTQLGRDLANFARSRAQLAHLSAADIK